MALGKLFCACCDADKTKFRAQNEGHFSCVLLDDVLCPQYAAMCWQMSPLNLIGLLVNSCGVGWYAYEKFLEGRRKQYQGSPKVLSEGVPLLSMGASTPMGSSQGEAMTLSRDGSQV